MSEAYRQKLLNWFCSMSLLALVCSLALVIGWRIVSINVGLGYSNAELPIYAGPFGESFMPYFQYFPALAFWHLCDFLQDSEKVPRWGWFSRYRGFALLLLIASPFAVIGGAGGVHLTGCGGVFYVDTFDPPVMRFSACPSAGFFETTLVIVFAPLVLLACANKAMAMLLSHWARHD